MNHAPTLSADGYTIAPRILRTQELSLIKIALDQTPLIGAGTRNLLELGWCRDLVEKIKVHSIIREMLPKEPVAVQCTLFDKTEEKNWLVALHQDVSIPVKGRSDDPRLGVWSSKEGQDFVQAPPELLEQLIGVRIHIDECSLENGPLRVVPGSHRHGRLCDAKALQLRDSVGEVTCTATAGDALLLRPLLLHASSKAISPGHRRVLHFLLGPQDVGYNLRWRSAV